MTSCRNGVLLIKGAVPLREVMSLWSGDYPPLQEAACLSVTKLINQRHQLMSVDISNPPPPPPHFIPMQLLMRLHVSEEHTSCYKNHFFNGRDRGKGVLCFR